MEHYNMTLEQLEAEITQLTSDKRGTKSDLYSDVQRALKGKLPSEKVEVDYMMDGKIFWVRLPSGYRHIGCTLFMVTVTCAKQNYRDAGYYRPRGYYASADVYAIKSIELTPVSGMTKEQTIDEIIAYAEGVTKSWADKKEEAKQQNIAKIHRLLKDRDLKGLLNAYESLDYTTKQYLRETDN